MFSVCKLQKISQPSCSLMLDLRYFQVRIFLLNTFSFFKAFYVQGFSHHQIANLCEMYSSNIF